MLPCHEFELTHLRAGRVIPFTFLSKARRLAVTKSWSKLDRFSRQTQAVTSYCTHRITNAVAEGVNSKIMSIKRRVGGFRNVDNFKTAIFFCSGGLELYPR